LVALLCWPAVLTAQTGGVPVSPSATATVFDAPSATERIKLGAVRGEPAAKRELTCFHFAELRVKQLDLGEVGAAQLAILPNKPGAKRAVCQKKSAPGEIVIPRPSVTRIVTQCAPPNQIFVRGAKGRAVRREQAAR
jgi:hypothetical protein